MKKEDTTIRRLLFAAARGSPPAPESAKGLLAAILARLKNEASHKTEGGKP